MVLYGLKDYSLKSHFFQVYNSLSALFLGPSLTGGPREHFSMMSYVFCGIPTRPLRKKIFDSIPLPVSPQSVTINRVQ